MINSQVDTGPVHIVLTHNDAFIARKLEIPRGLH